MSSDALPPWESFAEDIECVMDAVGSEDAFLWGDGEGGPVAVLFAASHPDRVRGLILFMTSARFLATFDGPGRAVGFASSLRSDLSNIGLPIRTGIHTGEVEKRDGDIGGLAVHLGARIMAAAGAGEILVSRTVKDLVIGSSLAFEDRGSHALKGIDGEWQLFAVATS